MKEWFICLAQTRFYVYRNFILKLRSAKHIKHKAFIVHQVLQSAWSDEAVFTRLWGSQWLEITFTNCLMWTRMNSHASNYSEPILQRCCCWPVAFFFPNTSNTFHYSTQLRSRIQFFLSQNFFLIFFSLTIIYKRLNSTFISSISM